MKATELRIGNLVTISYMNSKVCKITDILSDVARFDVGEFNSHTIYPYIEPIPLTEEWLLKLPNDVCEIPSWIEFVHELQNWYWVKSNCKKELAFK